MTTQVDNRRLRFATSPGTETSQGLGTTGFQDPTASWPREQYFLSSNLNFAATTSKNRADLYLGGGAEGISFELGEPITPVYPYNQVSETVSGHVIEVNDTPGGERILIKHNSGSGVELRADGTVIISSTKNTIQVCAADQTVIVDGEATLVYKGNLNLKVDGDLNIDVGGNYNVKTAGNRIENILGSDRKQINGNQGEIVRGTSSKTVVGQSTDTRLGGYTTSTKGQYSNQVQGDALYAASGTTNVTSESKMNISSADVNMSGSSLSVFGETGTIGGESIIAYVKNIYGVSGTFTAGVKAPTFEGKLKGKADDACQADFATTAGQAPLGPAGSPGSQSHTAVDTTATALPNGQNVTDYLTKSANGIRRVKIDIGDFIKNHIDKTVTYDGISTATLNTAQARSALRDPANASNQKFIGALVSEGTIPQSYFSAAPAGVGRVVNGNPTPIFGQTEIGQASGVARVSDAVVPRRGRVAILPDPNYNPDFLSSITPKTKLAPGISIAKFLGSNGDPTTMDFIRDPEQRKKIARGFYLHAELMRSIQINKGEFADFRLVVAEGMYKPGPTETVTANSINDLKMKGRAVVYELYDKSGNVSNFNTFNLAVYWKNSAYFDKLILSYDTIEGQLKAQIIVIMPELSADWSANFAYEVETQYNGRVVTSGELMECLPYAAGSVGADPSYSAPVGGYTGENGRLDPSNLVSIGPGHMLRSDAGSAYLLMVQEAARDGISWTITDSYRDYATQVRLAQEKGLYSQGGLAATPGTSKHGWGLAVDLGGGANSNGTPQNNWLRANAGRFGFKTIPREPWHWEYGGDAL